MRRGTRILGVVVVCAAILNVGSAVGVASARTTTRTVGTGSKRRMHPLATRPRRAVAMAAAGSGKLTFHGGTVLHGTTTYAVFWQPPGTYMSPAYKTDVALYLSSVGGTSMYSVLGQYYDINGSIENVSNYGGAWTDTTSFSGRGTPSAPLSDAAMSAEVQSAATANPSWVQPGNHAIYLVFLPRGIYQRYDAFNESFVQYCAYHSYYTNPQTLLNAYYAVMPYAGTDLTGCGNAPAGQPTPNGDADADAEVNLISHEQFETVTDPHLDAWYDAAGYELSDKCAYTYGTIGSDGGDVTLNGQRFKVQSEFSNADNACVVDLPTVLTAVPSKLKPAAGSLFTFGVSAMYPVTKTNEYGFANSVTVTSSDPHMEVVPATRAYTPSDRGSFSFFVTLWTAGPQTLTATDAADGLSVTTQVTVSASGVVNGGFESGLTGWTRTGAVRTTTTAHSGAAGARAGTTTPTTTSTLAQAFIAPFGASQLDVWYRQSCADVAHDWMRVTNRDVTTLVTKTVVGKTCTDTGQWAHVSTPIQPGHKYRVTLTNHDDLRPTLVSYTDFDDIGTS